MVFETCALCVQGMIMGPKTAISMLVGAILGESHSSMTGLLHSAGTYQQQSNISSALFSHLRSHTLQLQVSVD